MALKYDQYKLRFHGEIYFYGNASHGFYDTLVWLQESNPKPKPNIVMPVYIPAKLYRFVLAAGYEPIFYDVNLNCGFDPEEVAGLINEQTQAVFAVHYFGIPCPVQKLKEFTSGAEVFLIEDCVHTLNSRSGGKEIGTIGDCAMFSARKMLQLPSGGYLVLNNPRFNRTNFSPSYRKHVRSIFTACHLVTSRMKYNYYDITRGYDPLKLAWIPGTGYIDFSDKQYVRTKKMSRLTRKYLTSVDLDIVANQRRFNYEYLLNGINDMKFLQPVYPKKYHVRVKTTKGWKLQLKDGITPYSFPVLVPAGSREVLRRLLCDIGVGCGAGWPETPFHHQKFVKTKILSDRLLEFPVHQGINVHQLERVISCLERYDLSTHPDSIMIGHLNGEPVTA